jgi:hypothetical protein
VDLERPSHRDAADAPLRAARALERLRASGSWTVVAQEDGVLVLRRR